MNIHEYQAKSLLSRYNVLIPGGQVASSPKEAKACALALGGQRWAVKAQVHAGGRGAGRFNPDHDGQGGVRLASSPEDVEAAAQAMLGRILVTRQTGQEGRRVNRVYVERSCPSVRECYLCIFVDRSARCVTIMASSQGGMDIEELAAKQPELIQRVIIDPAIGLQPFHARKLAYGLGFEGKIAQSAMRLIEGVGCAFLESEASIVEINPLAISEADEVIALDAKIVIDDNSLFRHPDIAKLHDENEEDPSEFEASSHHLSYVKLSGQVGCMVNGAGLAMATMDIIRHYGAMHSVAPANFLDVGGSATAERVAAAFKIILRDRNVRGILVNIFGGIMRCDVVAEGIVAAACEVELKIPLVVRLEGTNVELGKKILSQSDLVIQTADTLADAAQMIVAAVRRRH